MSPRALWRRVQEAPVIVGSLGVLSFGIGPLVGLDLLVPIGAVLLWTIAYKAFRSDGSAGPTGPAALSD